MPDTKISNLTEVTTPNVSDVLPIVSGATTKKVTVTNLLALVPAAPSKAQIATRAIIGL